MYKLIVIYPTPAEPEQFKDYYARKHVPMARGLPGLLRCEYAYPQPLGEQEAPFCVFEGWFESREALFAALESEQGQALAADVANYSPAGATLLHGAVEN